MKKKGFTLIELIVAVAMIAVIAILIRAVFSTSQDLREGKVTELKWRSTVVISIEEGKYLYSRQESEHGSGIEVCNPHYKLQENEKVTDSFTEYYVAIKEGDNTIVYAIDESSWKELKVGKRVKFNSVIDSFKSENVITQIVF